MFFLRFLQLNGNGKMDKLCETCNLMWSDSPLKSWSMFNNQLSSVWSWNDPQDLRDNGKFRDGSYSLTAPSIDLANVIIFRRKKTVHHFHFSMCTRWPPATLGSTIAQQVVLTESPRLRLSRYRWWREDEYNDEWMHAQAFYSLEVTEQEKEDMIQI